MSVQQRLAASEKEQQVLELVKGGHTFRQIAAAVGYTNPGAAHNAFTRALKRTIQPVADDVRAIELQRLDAMLAAVWAPAQRGNLQAQSQVLRLMERRAAYLGLDAPKRQEVTGADGGPIQMQAVDAQQQLQARLTELHSRRATMGALPPPGEKQDEHVA